MNTNEIVKALRFQSECDGREEECKGCLYEHDQNNHACDAHEVLFILAANEIERLQKELDIMATVLLGSENIGCLTCTNGMKSITLRNVMLKEVPMGCDGNCRHDNGTPNTKEDVIDFIRAELKREWRGRESEGT